MNPYPTYQHTTCSEPPASIRDQNQKIHSQVYLSIDTYVLLGLFLFKAENLLQLFKGQLQPHIPECPVLWAVLLKTKTQLMKMRIIATISNEFTPHTIVEIVDFLSKLFMMNVNERTMFTSGKLQHTKNTLSRFHRVEDRCI